MNLDCVPPAESRPCLLYTSSARHIGRLLQARQVEEGRSKVDVLYHLVALALRPVSYTHLELLQIHFALSYLALSYLALIYLA